MVSGVAAVLPSQPNCSFKVVELQSSFPTSATRMVPSRAKLDAPAPKGCNAADRSSSEFRPRLVAATTPRSSGAISSVAARAMSRLSLWWWASRTSLFAAPAYVFDVCRLRV